VIEYFDSHCHLTDAAFREDREAVLRRAREAGVTRIVTIASTLADARAAVLLSEAESGVWSTAGVHPHEAGAAGPGDVREIEELARSHDGIVAIGETGLDYHYDNAPRARQRNSFASHLALASELDLPVVVHSREADDDVAAALRDMPAGTRGVLHCFTGGPKAFGEAMAAGWYVSFSGIASFPSFGASDLLLEVPRDRLLAETDAPYLAPVPVRGKRNEPAFVSHVAAAIGRHLETTPEEVARLTTENAMRFYGIH
jgi:TatD DNase family protein